MSGAPLSPHRAASAFRTTVGVVTRERVKITYDSWKEYTKVENQKAGLLKEIFKSFYIPEQHKASVQRYALLAACKAWRNFKSTLIKDYVEKDLTPFQKYPFVEEYWEDFVAKKKTNDFRIESEAHRALQAKNTHPHRLGTAGYAGKIPQWRDQNERARQLDASPPFARITSERSQQWLMARLSTSSSGVVSLPNPADVEVLRRMVRYRTTLFVITR